MENVRGLSIPHPARERCIIHWIPRLGTAGAPGLELHLLDSPA